MFDVYGVSVLNDSHDGILWLKLQHKFSNYTLLPCVYYLPPENSSRNFDDGSFYDHSLTSVYQYENDGFIYICGDFNSRCGAMDDFIVGVDDVPQRETIDFATNKYTVIDRFSYQYKYVYVECSQQAR